MIGLKRNRGTLLTGIVCALFVGACTDDSGPSPTSERLIQTFIDENVTHYGYIDGQRYEAVVDPDQLRDSDVLEAAMAPTRAIELAITALAETGNDPSNFAVCEVKLIPHVHRDRYYYLVNLCRDSKLSASGFRVPVLLSGHVIQPKLSEDQS